MLNRLLKRLALNLLLLPYDLYAYAGDVKSRLRKQDRIIFGEQKGGLAAPSPCKRAAIVAAYPNRHSLPFLANLLDGLAANGFFVLVVAGEKLPPDFEDFICARCHHLIEKYTTGRDFGSYKTGWEWINKHINNNELGVVALVNDSLYWPRYIEAVIGEILEQKNDWLCLFENFQTLYHAQSFFQMFRAPVFKSNAFIRFWQNYKSPSARLRVITKGEAGLTRSLFAAGFEPQAYYNSVRLRADILRALTGKEIPSPLNDVLNITLGFESRKETGRPPVRRDDFLAMLPADVAHKVSVLAEKYNPTHSTGLLCNYLYRAPVKRDICYRDVLSMSDLVALAQGFSPEEKEAMLLDLRRKGVPADIAGIRKIPQRLLWTGGRI